MIAPQLALDFDALGPPLTCAHGSPWQWCVRRPCAACAEQTARYVAEFRAGVARGEWDEDGYSPPRTRA